MEDGTLKGLRPTLWNRKPSQPLQGCKESLTDDDDPGFQGKPWAEISQRFQRN
jgi:hypothetical protein